MKKKTVDANQGKFVIALTYSDGVCGELTGEGGKVLRFQTEAEANKAIANLLKSKHYSWNGVSMKCVEH